MEISRSVNEDLYKSAQGQDKWLNEIVFRNKEDGFFVELGSMGGEVNSNTFYFEKQLNWDGLCIEANEELFKDLKNLIRESYQMERLFLLSEISTQNRA